jgi:hypothetical protein
MVASLVLFAGVSIGRVTASVNVKAVQDVNDTTSSKTDHVEK